MINWLKKRKRNKEAEKLEKFLSDKLGQLYPDFKEMGDNSKFSHSSISVKPSGLHFSHSMNPSYYEEYGKSHRIHFKFEGFQIKKLKSQEFVKIPVTVNYNLIFNVEIESPEDFWKTFDTSSIILTEPVRTEFEYTNDDEKKLKKILKDIDEETINKIDTTDSFEIELNDKKYYTILDMEDGNYIGVNSKGQVFRLHHDSEEQAKMINKSVKDFLTNFSGDKNEFANLFN